MTTLEELMQAALAAAPERKVMALRVLRGELAESSTRPGTGPLLMGMSASAKFLGVSRATLWRMVRAGRLEKVELYRGSFRIRRSDLEAIGNDDETGKP
jgi:excisionase family DNA binding protein